MTNGHYKHIPTLPFLSSHHKYDYIQSIEDVISDDDNELIPLPPTTENPATHIDTKNGFEKKDHDEKNTNTNWLKAPTAEYVENTQKYYGVDGVR